MYHVVSYQSKHYESDFQSACIILLHVVLYHKTDSPGELQMGYMLGELHKGPSTTTTSTRPRLLPPGTTPTP